MINHLHIEYISKLCVFPKEKVEKQQESLCILSLCHDKKICTSGAEKFCKSYH